MFANFIRGQRRIWRSAALCGLIGIMLAAGSGVFGFGLPWSLLLKSVIFGVLSGAALSLVRNRSKKPESPSARHTARAHTQRAGRRSSSGLDLITITSRRGMTLSRTTPPTLSAPYATWQAGSTASAHNVIDTGGAVRAIERERLS